MELLLDAKTENVQQLQDWIHKHDERIGSFINGGLYFSNYGKYEKLKDFEHNDLCMIAILNEEDLNYAIKCCSENMQTWFILSEHEKLNIFRNIASFLKKHAKLLALAETVSSFRLFNESLHFVLPSLISCFIKSTLKFCSFGRSDDWKPVVGIIHWNYSSIIQIVHQITVALAEGNAVILFSVLPLSLPIIILAEIATEAGLPKGILNVFTCLTDMLTFVCKYPALNCILFSGLLSDSCEVAKAVANSEKLLITQIFSPQTVILFDSADLESSLDAILIAICSAGFQNSPVGTKIFIQQSVWNKAMAGLQTRLENIRIGEPLQNVQCTYRPIKEEIKQSLQNSEVFPASNMDCSPLLISNLELTSLLNREAIPNSLLFAESFRTSKEVIQLANASIFGFSVSLWTEKLSLALEVSKKLKVSTIWINSFAQPHADFLIPGWKKSSKGYRQLHTFQIPNWSNSCECYDNVHYQNNKYMKANLSKNISPKFHYKLLIDGNLKTSLNYRELSFSSHNLECMSVMVPEISRTEIYSAVQAAFNALSVWGNLTTVQRIEALYILSDNLEYFKKKFITVMFGSSCNLETANKELDAAISRIYFWSNYAINNKGKFSEMTADETIIYSYEPKGVISIICPDQPSFLSFMSLIIPAIIFGNTILIVPSYEFPIPVLEFTLMLQSIKQFSGVINVISGFQPDVANVLAECQDISHIWNFSDKHYDYTMMAQTAASNLILIWNRYINDWFDNSQAQGEEFYLYSTQTKIVYIPTGDSI